MKDYAKLLEAELFPLYKELYSEVPSDYCAYTQSPFCIQWGAKFPETNNQGIIFVGRSVNGWLNERGSVEDLFDKSGDAEFNNKNQMKWVEETEKCKTSSFWRVIKGITSQIYGENEWYKNIAWSNVCKLAPYNGGNPTDRLYYQQLPIAQKILEKEIEVLSPKVLVFITGESWAKDFTTYLNGGSAPIAINEAITDDNRFVVYSIKGYYIIQTERPEYKPGAPFVENVVSLINNL